jgi:drug/metabolite transporter (DMT)-like permease
VASKHTRSVINVSLLLLVTALFGCQLTFQKIGSEELPPVMVSFLYVLLSGMFVFPFFLVERRRKRGSLAPAAAERSLKRWDNVVDFLMIGVVGATASTLFVTWGIARSTASNGALLGLTSPVMMALMAVVILGERLTLVRCAGLIIALTGVLVLSMKSPEAVKGGLAIDWSHLGLFNTAYLAGNLLLLLGCAGGCLNNVFSKRLMRRFSVLEVTMGMYALTIFTLAGLTVYLAPSSFAALSGCSRRVLIALMLLGINGGITGILWNFLVSRLQLGQAAAALYLVPIFGVLEAAIILHESITLPMIIGGAITLAATILVTTLDRGGAKPQQPTPIASESQPTASLEQCAVPASIREG